MAVDSLRPLLMEGGVEIEKKAEVAVFSCVAPETAGNTGDIPAASDSSGCSVPVVILEGNTGEYEVLEEFEDFTEQNTTMMMMTGTNTITDDDLNGSSFLNTPVIEGSAELSQSDLFPEIDFDKSEKEVPVEKDESFDEIWNVNVAPEVSDPMACVNPLDVEGKQILEAPIVFEPIVEAPVVVPVTVPAAQVNVPKPQKKKLRLIMPKPEPALAPMPVVAEPAVVPTTPEVVDAIEESLRKNSEESIDLLAYVTDSTIKVDDPAFLAFIGNTTPLPMNEDPMPSTSKAAAVPPKGKRIMAKATRKAERRTAASKRAPAINENIKIEEEEDDAPVAGTSRENKYRRMRDLNNEASKRCRQNRKRKQASMEEEVLVQEKRNAHLKAKCQKMEELVARMKKNFIKRVASKPKTPLDLDQIMADRLSSF